MKKKLFILFCFAWGNLTFSQNYVVVDSLVKKYPKNINTTSKLINKINSDFENNYDKVRAIYTWIANNIEYDPKEFGKFNFSYTSKSDSIVKNQKYIEQLSNRVIRKKKAVCEGYSVLFFKLCKELKIEAKIVTGDSKTKINDIGRRYRSNHAWNIVNIKNTDYLIDTTWGAGTYSSKFNKKLNFSYFFTNPNLFIRNHYPDNYENALLDKIITKENFLNSPLIYNPQLTLITPLKGLISRKNLNQIQFAFKYMKNISKLSYSIGNKNYEIDNFTLEDDKLYFVIESSNTLKGRELIFYFDGKPSISYKVK